MNISEFFSALRKAMGKPGRETVRGLYPLLRIKDDTTGRVLSPYSLVFYDTLGYHCTTSLRSHEPLAMPSDLERQIMSSTAFPDGPLREPLMAIVSGEGFSQRGRFIGVDVGIVNSVVRSDGYMGKRLKTGSPITTFDREAARTILAARDSGKDIAIENPDILSTLNVTWPAPYRLHYFGAQLRRLAENAGVTVGEVSPTGTYSRCELCGAQDENPRFTKAYRCRHCGHETDIRLMAARNIARKAEGTFPFTPIYKTRSLA